LSGRIYQEDSYQTSFEARVVDIFKHEDGYAIVLDATGFYPESGGQPSDRGTLGGLQVVDVIEQDNHILHLTPDKPGFGIGTQVEGRIDWQRRFINMQQHTGQHILSQAFLSKLNARTVSSKLGIDHSTIDVDRLDLDWQHLADVERLANSIVYEDRPVKIYEAPAGEVEGLRIKKPLKRKVLRIVEIDGFDKSPCGGTHCRRTGEVGLIKILRWEKVRDTSRIEFICGRLAEDDYFWKSRFIVELAQELTTKDINIPAQIRNIMELTRQQHNRIEELEAKLVCFEARQLEEKIEHIKDIELIVSHLREKDASAIRAFALELTSKPRRVALLAAGKERVHLVFSRSMDLDLDMRPVIAVACEVLGGKGGGRPEVCQGGGRKVEAVAQALESARRQLISVLG